MALDTQYDDSRDAIFAKRVMIALAQVAAGDLESTEPKRALFARSVIANLVDYADKIALLVVSDNVTRKTIVDNALINLVRTYYNKLLSAESLVL